VINIEIAGIDETDEGYEILYIQEGSISMTVVSKDLSSVSSSK
jgi:hypothetical protein